MPDRYSRTKHLDYITTAIERMAHNSSMCKGWTVIITLAILAFDSNELNRLAPLLAILALIALWKLDSYYLRLERLFRNLYDDVRLNDFTHDPYTMNVAPYCEKVPSVWKIMFSNSETPFYIPIVIVAIYMAGLAYEKC